MMAKRKHGCYKFYIKCEAKFQQNIQDDNEINGGFYAETKCCFEADSINDHLQESKVKILKSLSTFESRDSSLFSKGWTGVTIQINNTDRHLVPATSRHHRN